MSHPPQAVVGLGTDVVDVARMRTVLGRTPRFAERVFTPAERELCDRRRDSASAYAARFAVKEAALKALGCGLGEAPLVEFEVVRHPSGQPELVLGDTAARLAERRGVGRWLVSISHSDLVALAVVIAVAGPTR